MRARDVMTPQPRCCTPDTSLEEVARMMVDYDCGAIPVVDDLVSMRPVGMITDRDIVTCEVAFGRNPIERDVRDCMTAPPITISEHASLDDCVRTLELGQIRRLIVVDGDGRCCGIVAQADVASHASKRLAGELLRRVSEPAGEDVNFAPHY